MIAAVMIPTYNERDNVGWLLKRIFELELAAGDELRVIVVDDDSPDGTGELLDELVGTYGDLATVLLSSKKTEAGLVRSICADAHRQAHARLYAARDLAAAGRNEEAAGQLESAATAAAMIATEGDKAVAAVRNRLLEGGHHHHATAEVAKKYDTGYVVVTKAAKKLLLADAGAIGRLAGEVRKGTAGADEIDKAAAHLKTVYEAAVE